MSKSPMFAAAMDAAIRIILVALIVAGLFGAAGLAIKMIGWFFNIIL